MYHYVAHMGAVWRFNAVQYARLVRAIRERKPINLDDFGGRMVTGRLIVLEHLISEVTSGTDG